jgi:hypothetical protein
VPFDGGWLAVVHEVHRPKQFDERKHNPLMSSFWPPVIVDPVAPHVPVVYLHRFAMFDADLQNVRLSRSFHFRKLGIEFCAGLVAQGSSCLLSFGVADNEAWLAEVSSETIRSMFA